MTRVPLKRRLTSDDDLHRLAGVTGLGWTVSVLGYLGSLVGYGDALFSRLVADPQVLLYLGAALFVATLGLDRLQGRFADET